jgi:hypothetical protein
MKPPRVHQRRFRLPSEKVSLDPEIAAALERLREAGNVNMRDIPAVLARLQAEEALDAADWVDTHRAEYGRGMARGFVIQND